MLSVHSFTLSLSFARSLSLLLSLSFGLSPLFNILANLQFHILRVQMQIVFTGSLVFLSVLCFVTPFYTSAYKTSRHLYVYAFKYRTLRWTLITFFGCSVYYLTPVGTLFNKNTKFLSTYMYWFAKNHSWWFHFFFS